MLFVSIFVLIPCVPGVYGAQVTGATTANCAFSPASGEMIGFRISQNEIYDACTSNGTATDLPKQLVVSPGVYVLSFPKESGGTFSRVINAKEAGV